jgi:hypothetical protein
LTRLIADLDNARFATRQDAAKQLEQLGELAVPALKQTLAAQPGLDTRRRIEGILDKLEGWDRSPERMRFRRAMQLLEGMATPEAARILEAIAGGAPESRLTQEAKEAVGRLAAKQRAKP